MSEPRVECYKCLNNGNCISSADYRSIYCMTHRKFELNNLELHKEWERKALKYDYLIKRIEKKIDELGISDEDIYLKYELNKLLEE